MRLRGPDHQCWSPRPLRAGGAKGARAPAGSASLRSRAANAVACRGMFQIMKGTSPVLAPEELLRHAGWLRRLAHALASDSAAAEDAVQDTYLAALTTPPSADRPARPWLA